MNGEVWAISMVKDEQDVIEGTIRHLLSHCVDGIIVADNNSTDGTLDTLNMLARETHRLRVKHDDEVGYYQAEKMSRLADWAFALGAEWVVPFDADELWWTWQPEGFADQLRKVDESVKVVEAKLMNYFPTGEDPQADTPFERIVHRQAAHQELGKVAVRWQQGSIIWQGNHGVTLRRPGRAETLLEISHFPYRSERQFITKALNGAAAYRATDLPEDQGLHWRGYGDAYDRGGEEALLGIYNQWFHFERPDDADPPLVLDPAPFLRR